MTPKLWRAIPLSLTVALPASVFAAPTLQGNYKIISAHSGKALAVAAGSTTEGTKVHQWTFNGNENQIWEIRPQSDGTHLLVAKHSGQALQVADASLNNGAILQQRPISASGAQRFQIDESYGGSAVENRFKLRNVRSGKMVDVANWSTADGGSVIQWAATGNANQDWLLQPLMASITSTSINGVDFDSKSVGGTTTDNGWNLWSNGYMQENTAFTATTQLHVYARGQYANGWPIMTIAVDGKTIATTTVNSDAWKKFSYSVTGYTGNHTVRINFTNDYYQSGNDRNLYVRNMVVDTEGQITPPTTSAKRTAAQLMASVYRGTNYGQHHEAGRTDPIPTDDLDTIRANGFNLIRIPVKWDDHADGYGNINTTFFNNVKTSVDRALARGFMVVLDTHHENWLDTNFNTTTLNRLKTMWKQIGNGFKGYSDRLIYETLNEPHVMSEANVDLVNNEIRQVIRNVVGEKDRTIFYAVHSWNWSTNVEKLDFNHAFDPYIGATIHYYHPNDFTHKTAWSWPGTGDNSQQRLLELFDQVEAWSNRTGYSIFLGEFGVNHGQYNHDWASVIRYYNAVSTEARKRGWGYAVWEDDGWFKLFDRNSNTYITDLKNALAP